MPRRRPPAFGPPRGAREAAALHEALETAFNVSPKEARGWTRKAGLRLFRVLRVDGEVAGTLALYPFGHWFGGRTVPARGVAGVAVLPQFRDRGVASRMMEEALREMAREGAAVSSLYPATHPVYRRAGYEIAGTAALHTLRVDALRTRAKDPAVRPARPRDRAAIRTLYREFARPIPGMIDRTDYFWWRALARARPKARTWILEGEHGPEGYCVLEPQEPEGPGGPHYNLWMPDAAFATPAAGRRLLAFLASHRSLAGEVTWIGGPSDPLLGLAEEPFTRPRRTGRWMFRVVDLRAAVRARGFPPGLEGAVDLEVEDDLLPGNAGRWSLRVAKGRGRLVRGGSGAVRVDARGLGPLYTGHQSPFGLRLQGRLDGPDGDLERLGALFAGPAPWMRDGF